MPRLAIERWTKNSDAPDNPIALIVEAAHGQLIHAVSDAAAARGARAGMRLTDARAIDPGLKAVPADLAGDSALLARLARWASRWSPLVEVDGDPSTALGAGGLRLDASGIAHLFGGERGLLRDIQARFAGLGLTARVAIAATAGAAWGLARFGPSALGERRSSSGQGPGLRKGEEGLTPSRDLASLGHPLPRERDLAPLPVAALRLPAEAVRTLERLGLKTVGDLVGVPRKSLARRFREADNPIDALDRMLGRKPEPLTAQAFAPPPRALLRLAEPVTHPEAAAQALDLLVPRLAAELEARRLGARRLHLAGYRIDGSVAGCGVATAIPSREPAHLRRLLAEKAATLDPGFGFDGFALEASWSEPLGARQDSLVDAPPGEADVARLVDRLSVKLGADKVRRPVAIESHVPERASGWGDCVSSLRAKRSSPGLDCRAPSGLAMTTARPSRLLDRPESIGVIYATPEGLPRRFVWRRSVHDVARAEGPERIAPEWWRERSTARLRDYYRVEDREGRRFWIFREGLHGDGRGGDPVWYLHGLFG